MTDGSFHCYNSSSEVVASNIFLCIFVGFDVIYVIKLSNAVTVGGDLQWRYNFFSRSAGSRDNPVTLIFDVWVSGAMHDQNLQWTIC